MSLLDDADAMGREVQMKREARERAKEAAEQAKKDVVRQEKQHEEDKREGMIDLGL